MEEDEEDDACSRETIWGENGIVFRKLIMIRRGIKEVMGLKLVFRWI